MALRIDDSSVALAADYCACFLHLGGDVDLADCGGKILAAMTESHVAKGACGAEVADSVSRSVGENIVGNGDQSVFLAKHSAVFADEGKTVNIGVNNDAKVVASLADLVHDALKVAFEWFGIVGETSCGFGIEHGVFNAKGVEEAWKDDAADTVDGIDTDTETACLHCLDIYEVEGKNVRYVARVEIGVGSIGAKVFDIGIDKCLAFGYLKHSCAVGCGEELALGIEKLQGVPLCGIMACGDDDAAVGIVMAHGKLCGGCGGKTEVDDIEPHAQKSSANHAAHHFS